MSMHPRISETEWEIMKVVWAKAPCSASDVIDALTAQDRTWHPKTIKTYLTRLVAKKALDFHKRGVRMFTGRLIHEKECVGSRQ